MDFKNMTMTLGVVVDNNDPTCSCKVRVAAPGEFDTASIDKEVIPWAEPLFMCRYQSFSKLVEGSKVWLIKNKDNLNEYFYMPCSDPNVMSMDYLLANDRNNPEIIFSKQGKDSSASITYNDNDGIDINVNGSGVKISPQGKIEINLLARSLKIENDKIYIGDELGDEYNQMVKGNKLVEILQDLQGNLSSLSMACTTATYTTGIVDAVNKCAQSLDPINDILSENVYIN